MELVTKLYSQADKFTKEEYLLSVLEEIKGMNDSSDKFNSRLVISLDKKSDINEYEEIFKIYNSIQNNDLKKLIVGIDYSGYANTSTCREHKYEEVIPIFEKFRQEKLGISIHLGEDPNYTFIPLNLFVPDRISHGCFLKDEHIEELTKKNVHIEICPTYCLKINKCYDYSEINMKKFWNKKIKNESGEETIFNNLSINSDCRTLMLTDISQEYYEIGISFKLGIKELKSLIDNAINSIFEKEKELQNKLKNILNNFNC